MPILPALESGQGQCFSCPPKPIVMPLYYHPHPGFGGLYLLRDGEHVEEFDDFCSEVIDVELWYHTRRGEEVTLAEIEEAVADDPDHDWRLHIHGAMSEYWYQRHAPNQWVLVEKGKGFA